MGKDMTAWDSDKFEREGYRLMRKDRYDEVFAVLRTGLARFPGDPELRLLRAVCLGFEGEYVGAREALLELLGEGFALSPVRFNLVKCCLALGRRAEALRFADELVEEGPKDAEMANMLGRLFMHHNRMEDALRYHEKAVRMDPKHADSYAGQAVCLHALRRRKKELEGLLRKALQHDKKNVYALNYLGNLYYDRGRRSLAAAFWLKIPKEDHFDPTTLRRMERYVWDYGKKHKRKTGECREICAGIRARRLEVTRRVPSAKELLEAALAAGKKRAGKRA